jgi:hypothetical protein
MVEQRPLDIVAAATRLGVRPDTLIAHWVSLRLGGTTFSASSRHRLEFTTTDLESLAKGIAAAQSA